MTICILGVLTFQRQLLPLKCWHLNSSQKTEIFFTGTNMKTMVGTKYYWQLHLRINKCRGLLIVVQLWKLFLSC